MTTTQEPLIEQPNQYIRDKAFRAHLEAVLGKKTAAGPEIPQNFNQTPTEKEPESAPVDRGDVIKCGLPASSRPSEGENRTDPLKCREQLLQNDPALKVITLNNMKRLPIEHIQWMIMAIKVHYKYYTI